MLTMLGRQLHASQRLVQVRAQRNPNELIEEESTFGERIADAVARFGDRGTSSSGLAWSSSPTPH